tara:strand:- start:1528 stop:1914 length:387 start_codon:yes stop_codon:yes gene_type:complete
MASKTVDEIMSSIESMSVLELAELVEGLKEKFGVSAMPAAVAAPAAGGGDGAAAAPAEKDTFDVVLAEVGPNKIPVIKVVRQVTGLGLKEAKALVDEAPGSVKDGVSKDEAEEVRAKLEAEGAKVEIK